MLFSVPSFVLGKKSEDGSDDLIIIDQVKYADQGR